MRLDFWNNPIVVSAFRVKNRRGALFHLTALYVLVLAAGGMVLQRYNDRIGGSWSRNYLLALLGLQFFLSALIALTTTAVSLRGEINNRTLDFQRIAALSPRQILLGKLVGEPTLAWMLAMATIPLVAWCWLLGVAGLSAGVLLLIYVNLASTTVLFGSLGLLQRLDTPGRPGSVSGLTVLWMALPIALAPPLMANAGSVLSKPWSVALIGLLTPIPILSGVAQGNAWHYCLLFYGLRIPLLLLAPLAQLILAFLCFKMMERRLINPLDTSVRKGPAYLVLLAIDLVAGGVFLEPVPLGLPLAERVGAFVLIHLLASFWLLTLVTPWRDSLESWVWRFRGKLPRPWDLWLGERSENGLALVTFSLLGVAAVVTAVILPFGWQDGFAVIRGRQALLALASITAILVVLTLSLGTLYQYLAAVAGRAGLGISFLTLLAVLVIPCHLVGYYYGIEWLLALTPSAHFASWLTNSRGPSAVPLLALYGLIFILSWLALRRRVAGLHRIVDGKLELMGVPVLKSVARISNPSGPAEKPA